MKFFINIFILILILFHLSDVFAVYQCGDKKDDCKCAKNNPFPCCDNGGNCTWWAWEQACCNWGEAWGKANPVHGNAKEWLGEAKSAGWPTGSNPVKGSIFVRTVGEYGHVGWVYKVYGDGSFDSSEMACWGWYGVQTHHHPPGYAQGFILPKCGGGNKKGCNDNDVYWFDGCGNLQGKAEECDDGNPCTDDGCSGESCYHNHNGNPCNDGNPCTDNDHCQGGGCVGNQKDCSSAGDICNDGVCEGGNCIKKPKGGNCDDGNTCTVNDSCQNGSCVGEVMNCTSLNGVCKEGVCENGNCVQKNLSGNPCEDGNLCTADDKCDNGNCISGKVVICDDGNPCTTETCEPQKGCVWTKIAGCCVANEECNDGIPCTLDLCVNNKCENNPIPDVGKLCMEGNLYFADSCGAIGSLSEDCKGCGCEDNKCLLPQCEGKECGPDGCEGSCGKCSADMDCSIDFECVSLYNPCKDISKKGKCEGNLALWCEDGEIKWFNCEKNGMYCGYDKDIGVYTCVKECIPYCEGKKCGGDGCGGLCGICPARYICNKWQLCEKEKIVEEIEEEWNPSEEIFSVEYKEEESPLEVEKEKKGGGCEQRGGKSRNLEFLILFILGILITSERKFNVKL